MSFHEPSIWWLAVLLVLPVIWWRAWRNARLSVVEFSSTHAARSVRASLWVHVRWLPVLLRTLAILLIAVSLARPQIRDEQSEVYTEGIAIQLVLDRSRSMLEKDYFLNGRGASRLDVAKHVISDFVDSDGELGGRPNDLIGVIQFGTFPDALCPFTLDQEHVLRSIDSIQSPRVLSEAHTAIGDAVALALERFRSFDEEGAEDGTYQVTSRIVILLTDGEDLDSEIDPETAARMAATMGVKVYAIGIGDRSARSGRPVNAKTLQTFALITGGQFYFADDTNALAEVYEDINRLERSRIEQEQFTSFLEVSLDSFEFMGRQWPPLIVILLVVLLAERVVVSTRLGGVA